MTHINQQLFQALMDKLGASKAEVYRQIDDVRRETFLEGPEAALVLAARNNLSIQRFSTLDQRQHLVAVNGRVGAPVVPTIEPVELRRQTKSRQPKAVSVDLDKVSDPELRDILRRDTSELNAATSQGIGRVAKMSMVMAGSIAEALLLDHVLSRFGPELISAVAALDPKDKPRSNDPTQWALDTLVKVAMHLNPPVREDVLAGAHQLKDWRNLVHPGKEVRASTKLRVTPKRAEGALAFLGMLVEDLER